MAPSTKLDGGAIRPAGRPRNPWTAFTGLAIAVGLGVTGGVAALGIWADPYWVFRTVPPWFARTGGVNRLLDTEMRRAKPLQVSLRTPDTVLIGSSTVYRGLDPADAGPDRVYNLGLSSLMAGELPTLASLVARDPAIRRVGIGLDAFMMSDFAGPPPVRADLATAPGRLAALLGLAIGQRGLLAWATGELDNALEPGVWHADGFKVTPDYPSRVTARLLAEAESRPLRFDPGSLLALDEALGRLQGREVRLYLSPVSEAEAAIEERSGPGPEWRRAVADLAMRRGVPFVDLSRDHPFGAYDPAQGSSATWIDHLHFRPVVGRWILARIGFTDAVPSRRESPIPP